jgi:hypothetical protein
MAKPRYKATTKPRGNCPTQCRRRFFGFGQTWRAAKRQAEQRCQAAGCHTPGGTPHACDCGHTTVFPVTD